MVLGRRVSIALADVSKRAEIERAIETTVTELGGLHVSARYDLGFSSSNLFSLVKGDGCKCWNVPNQTNARHNPG